MRCNVVALNWKLKGAAAHRTRMGRIELSIKDDITLGLSATIISTRDEVVKACERAAAVLGTHAQTSVASAKVSVKILPGLVQKLSKVSPLVAINLQPGENNSISLSAKIERYVGLQSRFFLIPISPKRLLGKAHYLNFLTSLEQELRAIDKGGGQFRRVGGRAA